MPGYAKAYPDLRIVLIGVEHDDGESQDVDSILRLDLVLLKSENWRLAFRLYDINLPGSAAKYISAKFSVIRLICCASPGSRNVSSISLIASATVFCQGVKFCLERINISLTPLKSISPRKALSSSMLSGLERKSPSKRLSTRAELFKNFARLRGLGSEGSV